MFCEFRQNKFAIKTKSHKQHKCLENLCVQKHKLVCVIFIMHKESIISILNKYSLVNNYSTLIYFMYYIFYHTTLGVEYNCKGSHAIAIAWNEIAFGVARPNNSPLSMFSEVSPSGNFQVKLWISLANEYFEIMIRR